MRPVPSTRSTLFFLNGNSIPLCSTHHFVLVAHHSLQVELDAGDLHAESAETVPGLVELLGGLKQRLGRYARRYSDKCHRAWNSSTPGHFQAQLGCADRTDVPTRAAADDDKIVKAAQSSQIFPRSTGLKSAAIERERDRILRLLSREAPSDRWWSGLSMRSTINYPEQSPVSPSKNRHKSHHQHFTHSSASAMPCPPPMQSVTIPFADHVALHRMQQTGRKHRAGRADRVAVRDGAAFHINDIQRQSRAP